MERDAEKLHERSRRVRRPTNRHGSSHPPIAANGCRAIRRHRAARRRREARDVDFSCYLSSLLRRVISQLHRLSIHLRSHLCRSQPEARRDSGRNEHGGAIDQQFAHGAGRPRREDRAVSHTRRAPARHCRSWSRFHVDQSSRVPQRFRRAPGSGKQFPVGGRRREQSRIIFWIYFALTGIHAIPCHRRHWNIACPGTAGVARQIRKWKRQRGGDRRFVLAFCGHCLGFPLSVAVFDWTPLMRRMHELDARRWALSVGRFVPLSQALYQLLGLNPLEGEVDAKLRITSVSLSSAALFMPLINARRAAAISSRDTFIACRISLSSALSDLRGLQANARVWNREMISANA